MATQNALQNIKVELFSDKTLTAFRDNLPAASEEHALAAAKRYSKMVYTAIVQEPKLQK